MNTTYKKIILVLVAMGSVLLGSLFILKKYSFFRGTQVKISLDRLVQEKNIVPIAILGSGPAGLSAAIYGARANIKTVVFSGNEPGGALTKTSYIENWPGAEKILGTELIENLKEQAQKFGAEFVQDAVIKADFSRWPFILTTQDGTRIAALTVIIATGSTPRTLGVPGEKELWGNGVTTCAVCDAPFHKDKDVVVVGGGDTAIEEAFQLSSYAKSITVLVRKDQMRAAASMQQRLSQVPNVKIEYNTEVVRINGTDHVTSVELMNNRTKTTTTKEVSGVFLAIGHDPNTAILKGHVALDGQGYIILTDRSQKTTVPGVFAAGDVEDNVYKQAGVASGNGIKAALDATTFLREESVDAQLLKKLQKQLFEPSEQYVQPLPKIEDVQELDILVATSKKIVVVDFYAPTCPTCLQMLPMIESVGNQMKDNATFVKVDTSEAPEISKKYAIKSIPLIIVFKDGKQLARYSTVMNKNQLTELINSLL